MNEPHPFTSRSGRRTASPPAVAALALLALLVLATPSGAGVLYDAATDFSASTNPNSPWSYRYTNGDLSLDGNYPLLPVSSTWHSQPAWKTGVGGFQVVAANQGASPINMVFNGYNLAPWNPGELYIHPGGSNDGGVNIILVAWTAAAAGLVDITYQLTDLDGNTGTWPGPGDGISWSLLHNLTPLDSGTLKTSGPASSADTTGSLSLSGLHVASGDSLYLAISPNAAGRSEFDSTSAIFRIDYTAVPEPGTLVLVLAALAALLKTRRHQGKAGWDL